MPTPRKNLLSLADPGWVHCVSRCVRRAYLAGDAWEHRRVWIEERLRLLAAVWACEVAAYAVMSNHIHVVVRVLPAVASTWSAEEGRPDDLLVRR
jgi:REP element-mobilizing transposase RayT